MCLDDQIISEYIDGELDEPWKSQVMEHLSWCESCKSRYNDIKSLQESIKGSVLDDDAISRSSKRVMRYMESNVIDKPKHTYIQKIRNFFSKKVVMPICAAALTFCFCMIIFNGSPEDGALIVDTPSVSLNIDNVVPVRTSDNFTTSQTLKDYSLEDIIKYLDDSGYDVTISPKVLSPIEMEHDNKLTVSPYMSVFFPQKIDMNK